MPWGKYRGRPIMQVPSGYLVWCLEVLTIADPYRTHIREELAARLGLAHTTSVMRPPDDLALAVKALIDAGYRSLAFKHHPDRGGDTETMQRVNRAMQWIRQWV